MSGCGFWITTVCNAAYSTPHGADAYSYIVTLSSSLFCIHSPADLSSYYHQVLGGEGAHGMLILSPAAVARLESYVPPWPLPKIFRLTSKGKLIEGIFSGETINTPSMLAVEDYIDSLTWAAAQGGVAGLSARSNANLAIVEAFVAENSWIKFLAEDKASRSNTSVCLMLELHKDKVKALTGLLEREGVAFDIGE